MDCKRGQRIRGGGGGRRVYEALRRFAWDASSSSPSSYQPKEEVVFMGQTDGWTDGDAAGDDIQSKIHAEVSDYFRESTIKTSRRFSGLR